MRSQGQDNFIQRALRRHFSLSRNIFIWFQHQETWSHAWYHGCHKAAFSCK